METDPGEIFGCNSVAADSSLWECDTVLLVSSVLKNYNAFIFRVRQFLLGGLDPIMKALELCITQPGIALLHSRRLDSSQTDEISETS